MPGSSPTIARRRPISLLKSVLLPTLGGPTITSVGKTPALPTVAGCFSCYACLYVYFKVGTSSLSDQHHVTSDRQFPIRLYQPRRPVFTHPSGIRVPARTIADGTGGGGGAGAEATPHRGGRDRHRQ